MTIATTPSHAQEAQSAQTDIETEQVTGEIFALAFRGGGLDTVVDLGVIHALLVSRRRPPHVVVGSSTGAISAAALAEIFQEPTEERKVARFRQFLDAYVEAPRELARTLVPDTNEVRAETPLKSIDLPIYPKRERAEREESVRTTFGLIRLINDLLSLRLRVSDLTRLANLILWWNKTGNSPTWSKWLNRSLIIVLLWGFAIITLWRVTPITWRMARASVGARYVGKARSASLLIRALYQWILSIKRFLARVVAGTLSYAVLLLAFPSGPILLLIQAMPFASGFFSLDGDYSVLSFEILSSLNVLVWFSFFIAYKRGKPLKKLLRQYRLHDEIGSSYTLKQYLVRLFDRNYYGKFDITDTVKRALDRSSAAQGGVGAVRHDPASPKTLRDYAEPRPQPGFKDPPPSIHVTPVVTNLCDGEAVPIAPGASVVDAILGALAVAPLFKPVWLPVIKDQTGQEVTVPCIDALNVVNEPIFALLDYLRWQHHRLPVKSPQRIFVYPVASFPADKPLETVQQYERLVDVVRRVVDLRRYQSASLERDLTRRFRKLMPKEGAIQWVPTDEGTKPFIAVEINRIDTPDPVRMQMTWLSQETAAAKREVILRAVATGCRTALRVVVAQEIRSHSDSEKDKPVECRKILHKILHIQPNNRGLPGNDPDSGPGLSEVCNACSWTEPAEKGKEHKKEIPWPAEGEWPLWPENDRVPNHAVCTESTDSGEGIAEEATPQKSSPSQETVPPSPPSPETLRGSSIVAVELLNGAVLPLAPTSHAVPQFRSKLVSPVPDPWVTLLFSGGVFRGVFQVGMLNGLVQAGVKPRVFAGSSVGSIMAAMASRIFAGRQGNPTAEVVRLAETFLGLDRLVLTDRFADLVRRLTLRGGATPVSIRDLDHVFRLYERRRSAAFTKNLRQVLAGLERLLYLTPYDVERMARSVRKGDYANAQQHLFDAVEHLLAGYGIGLELLGTEPMQTLILGHVLDSEADRSQTIEDYVKHLAAPARHLLITTTNLSTGRLEVLGKHNRHTPLLEALLASSAFPAVFRPRRSGEVFPQEHLITQLVDGGVMDNLPLLKVLEQLEEAAKAKEMALRPPVPHLVITGSLEPPCNELDPDNDKERLKELTEDWVQLVQRIKMLRFNKKVDAFARVQNELRSLWKYWHSEEEESEVGPVSVRVATVKPRWLCGTFAFHPMLGFRQEKQAASIAHGCAVTLVMLASLKDREAYMAQGTFNLRVDPQEAEQWQTAEGDLIPQPREKPGHCWFQVNTLCPFYRQLESMSSGKDDKSAAVRRIYELCGKKETHRRVEI